MPYPWWPSQAPIKTPRRVLPGLLLLGLMSGCAGINKEDFIALPELPSARVIAQDGRVLSPPQLLSRMRASQVIYLGETHDNLDHHRLQLKALQDLVDAGVRPAIGFEFFSREQTGWLMNFSLGNSSSLKSEPGGHGLVLLRERLGWSERDEWDYYAPLLQLARDNRLPVFGADLDKGLRVRLGRQGLEKLFEIERAELPASTLNSPAYEALMTRLLDRSHCHHASKALLARLYDTFLIRNEAMAESIVQMRRDLEPEQPVVMILGRGHTEFDMGVMERVAQREPALKQLNIGLVEGVSDNQLDFTPDPGPRVNGVDFGAPHGLYWITPGRPGRDQQDPCEIFKKGAHKRSG